MHGMLSVHEMAPNVFWHGLHWAQIIHAIPCIIGVTSSEKQTHHVTHCCQNEHECISAYEILAISSSLPTDWQSCFELISHAIDQLSLTLCQAHLNLRLGVEPPLSASLEHAHFQDTSSVSIFITPPNVALRISTIPVLVVNLPTHPM